MLNRLVSVELWRCPRQDSNLRTRFRRPVLYPLSYGGHRTVLSVDCWLLRQFAVVSLRLRVAFVARWLQS
jgi:hypothetical protein